MRGDADNDPLSRATFWSRFWFSWTKPLLDLGQKRPLDAIDLPPLALEDRSKYNRIYIETLWRNEQERCKNNKNAQTQPSLARAMAVDFFQTMWPSRCLLVLNSLSKIGQALALGFLLDQFEEQAPSSNKQRITSSGYFWAGIIILCGTIAFPTKQHSFFQLYRKGAQYRTGLVAAIYSKTLRLPSIRNNNDKTSTAGHVTNLASNDTERFLLTSIYFNILLSCPVEITTILLAGIYTMGPVFLTGYALLLLVVVPLQTWLSQQFVQLRSKIATTTDARVTLVTQAITGALVVKLQGWQVEWERKIAHLRKKEVHQLQRSHQRKAWNDALYYVSSLVVQMFVLGLYVGVWKEPLTPRIVYTTFSLWNLLQYSVTKHVPHAIMGLCECYVACERIQAFFELPEILEKTDASLALGDDDCKVESAKEETDPPLQLSNATCYWDQATTVDNPTPSKLALDSISLTFQPGKLYCVIGKVGSGKSALLQALIGELPLARGQLISHPSTSYAAQDPWIMDGTAQENIVMGRPFDQDFYDQVVGACCLKADFAEFVNGEHTIMGDRGVQCSGGQKARLALARALYCDAKVLLLDDPLSAVDAKVARSIYYNAIHSIAVQRGVCVVLVTHQHQFVVENTCILIDNGQLVHCGSFAECVSKSGGDLSEVLQTAPDEEVQTTPVEEVNSLVEKTPAELHIARKEKDEKDASFLEKRETGIIKGNTWLAYGKALGGMAICGIVLFLFAVTQTTFILTMTFVGKWAEAPAMEQSSQFWFSRVFGLTASVVVLAVFRAHLCFLLFLRAAKRLHNQMLYSVLRATMEFYDTNPLGRILNRFAADVGISDEILPFTVYDFGVGFIMFMGSIITAIVVLPLTLIIFPFLLWAFVRLKNMFVKTTRELKRLEGLGRSPLYAMMSESLLGIATIRSNGQKPYFCNKFETIHDTLIQAQFAFVACSRWFAIKLDFLSFVFLATATLCAVVVQEQGWFNLDPSILGLALSMLLQLAGANFPFMVRQSAEVTNHMVSVERIWEFGHSIPQEAPLVLESDEAHGDWPWNSSVVVSNVLTRYRENLPPCLENISFTIQPGERVGVVGRTGAGKTSLLQALFRVLEAEEGSITIGGVDISTIGLHKLRTSMAVITQSSVLFGGTLRENLDPYPTQASEKEESERLEVALRSVHMWDSIQSLPDGLDSIVAEGGTNFSVGQRQLLCLARACLADCRILVLDEATANVDETTDKLLQQTLRERFASATIIAIAHRLDTIMDYDKVLVLGKGRVLEYGSPVELLANPAGAFNSMVQSTGASTAELLRKKVKVS